MLLDLGQYKLMICTSMVRLRTPICLTRCVRSAGELRCIGATTLAEYRQYMEKDAAFERRFQQVIVGEPSVPDTINILRGLKRKYEGHHGVHITDRALVVAAELSDRYIQARALHR